MSELDTLRLLCEMQADRIAYLELQLYGPIGSGQGYRADAEARGAQAGPKLGDTLTQGERAQAGLLGPLAAVSTGDVCTVCGNFTMQRAGACLTCMTCGSTTGCS